MLQKTILLFLFSTIIFCSCNEKKDIIPQKKMTQVLLELQLAEALAQHLPKDSLARELKNSDSLKHFSAEILANNNVTETAFLQSMEYYKTQPEMLDSMYQTILSEITILHSKKNE